MKKFLNDPADLVAESLIGLAAAYPSLRVDHRHRVVLRARPKPDGTVAVFAGGGSGHEPLHAGFVGTGMLDAACVGEIFTSPTPEQVLIALRAVDRGAGVLQIVKNFAGDVMNFALGAELARAEQVTVEQVLIADDVSIPADHPAGRRGIGATVLVEKIAGAAAEAGLDLPAVTELARRSSIAARSMAVALSAGTDPMDGAPTFTMPSDRIEFGVGIHGERGRNQTRHGSARTIAHDLLTPILADADFTAAPVIAFLNGMGGTPMIELLLMYGEIATLLADSGITVARTLVGSYVTTMDAAGCSLTLLAADEELLHWWDAPVTTPALTAQDSR